MSPNPSLATLVSTFVKARINCSKVKASASLDALGRLADIELSGKAHASWISLSERLGTGSRGQSLPLRFVISRKVRSCHVSYTSGSGFTCQQNDLSM